MFKKETEAIKNTVEDAKKTAKEFSDKVNIGLITLGACTLITIGYILGVSTATTIYKFGGKNG